MQEDAQKVYSAYDIYIVNRREVFLFFKQKTAYEVRISGWSSDVCSSDLNALTARRPELINRVGNRWVAIAHAQYHPHIQVLLLKDRKSVVKGKSVSVRVDLGGRRINKKKKSIAKQKNRLKTPHKIQESKDKRKTQHNMTTANKETT